MNNATSALTTIEIEVSPVVIYALDYDCDGVGESWTRVNAPTFMVEALDKARARYAEISARQLDEKLARYAKAFGTYEGAPALVESIKRDHRPDAPHIASEISTLKDAIVTFAIHTSDHTGFGWDGADVGSVEDFERDTLARFIEEEGEDCHKVTYWSEAGYLSVFHSRGGGY